MKSKEYSVWEGFLRSLKLPEYALSSQSHIEIFGNKEISVENAKGILEYNDTYIKIVLGDRSFVIEGEKLRVDMFCESNIIVRGHIRNIAFE